MSDSTPRLPMCCPHELSKLATKAGVPIWRCIECGTEMTVVYHADPVDGQTFGYWEPVYE